jgi:hypothetical protein
MSGRKEEQPDLRDLFGLRIKEKAQIRLSPPGYSYGFSPFAGVLPSTRGP